MERDEEGKGKDAQQKSRRNITAPGAGAGVLCVCVKVTTVCVLKSQVLHLGDGFRQVGGYFCETLPSTVHNIVTAGARLWAL